MVVATQTKLKEDMALLATTITGPLPSLLITPRALVLIILLVKIEKPLTLSVLKVGDYHRLETTLLTIRATTTSITLISTTMVAKPTLAQVY